MKDVCFYLPNFLTSEECQKIEQAITQTSEPFYNAPASNSRKTSDVTLSRFGNIKQFVWKMYQAGLNVNKDTFGFNLFEANDFDPIFLAEYKDSNQGEYSWHVDASFSAQCDTKLTCIADISDEKYKGGEFSIFVNGETKIETFKPGDLFVFLSIVPHRVTPVTKGTRKSVTFWLTGPNWL